ncbi:MAG: putative sulfate exporter family transporter, partial [Aureliella sp.]
FVSIGLETNFRQLLPYLRGGKPLMLYACGQTLNLILTLAMAWLMFKVIFRDMIDRVLP